MPGIHGRIRLTLLLCLVVIPLLAVTWVELGYGWGTTPAVRSAVLDYLRQLPRQPAPPPPEPTVTGQPATPAEGAALDKTVEAFLGCLRVRDFAGSWEAVDAASAQGWSQESWVEQLKGVDPRGFRMEGLPTWPDTTIDVGTVRAFGQRGAAIVIFRFPIQGWVALVRQKGSWFVDLNETMRLLAWHDVRRQMPDRMDSPRMLMLQASSDEPMRDGFFTLLLASPKTFDCKPVAWRVDGTRAVVKLEGRSELHFAVSLRLNDMTWEPDYGSRLVEPGETLEDFGGAQACVSNLQQLGMGLMMYVQDYDEKFPPAAEWCDATVPYVRNRQTYECPAVPGRYGYAMNYKLSRILFGKVSQAYGTLALFDSSLLRINAQDYPAPPGASATWPPRHNHVVSYAFADGHAEAYEELLPPGWYRVVRPRPSGPGGPAGPGAPGWNPPGPMPPGGGKMGKSKGGGEE